MLSWRKSSWIKIYWDNSKSYLKVGSVDSQLLIGWSLLHCGIGQARTTNVRRQLHNKRGEWARSEKKRWMVVFSTQTSAARPGAFCEGLVEENGFPCCTCQQQFFVMLFYTWFFQTLTCTLPRLLFSNLAVACWLKKKHAACISPTWPATVQWWQFWVGKISRFNISARRCRQLHCPAIIVARKLGGLNWSSSIVPI